MRAIDYWFSHISGQSNVGEVFQAVATELPPLASLILDRSCQFQCQHCIFQKEPISRGLLEINAVLHVLKQLPNPKVIHEGRQFTPRQLPLLEAVSCAGYPIGTIESGTYTKHLDGILKSKLRFNWMDVSVDGPKQIHNLQRNSKRSWDVAIEGIKQARRVLTHDGKVTSLMTLTSLNCGYVSETAEELFNQDVDEWHLTTLSVRNGIEKLKASLKQVETALCQITKISKTHKNIFLRIYNLEDMRSLISIFGKKAFSTLLKNAKVTQNALVLDIGFPLFFYPASIAPGETLVIDADGWWRLPYCIKYALKELELGCDLNGQSISVYNVTKISEQTRVDEMFKQVVSNWRKYCGEKQLFQEQELFQNLI